MSAATITICDVVYEVQFDKGTPPALPSLTLTPITASGAAITGRLECCGCSYAIFAFGGLPLCTGTRDTTAGPCGNLLRLKVEWTCCPLTGWDGEGWYCVKSGSGGTCVPVELLEADRCDTSLTICSGPYATEDDAKVDCPIPEGTTATCDDTEYDLPGAMLATFTGDWSFLGSVVLTWNPSLFSSGAWQVGAGWSSPTVPDCAYYANAVYLLKTADPCKFRLRVEINGHVYNFDSDAIGNAPSSWSPFAWSGSLSSAVTGCGSTVRTGTATVQGIV